MARRPPGGAGRAEASGGRPPAGERGPGRGSKAGRPGGPGPEVGRERFPAGERPAASGGRPSGERRPGGGRKAAGPGRSARGSKAAPERPSRPSVSRAASAIEPRREREELIHGRNPVLEAARAQRVRRVLLARGLEPDARIAEIRSLVQRVEEVEADRLDGLAAGGVHQGVVAELLPRRYLTLRQLLDRRPTLLVALDSIMDPQNLGAILRSAEAAGAGGAVLPERRSAPLSAVAVKASSGASELIPVARVSGLASAISEIRRAGLWCVALDPHGDLAPWEFDLAQPVCIVVGGEGAGVHRLVRERCDARIRLPMRGRVESLNASAAAAVLLYEVCRQRARSG